jgi:putative ABC transport system substrate-binding protein
LLGQRDQLVRLAARHALPTFFTAREFVEAGGLISYGPNINNGYRQAGVYTGRILSGAIPSELPILQPTSFSMRPSAFAVFRLMKVVPANILALADEVIE